METDGSVPDGQTAGSRVHFAVHPGCYNLLCVSELCARELGQQVGEGYKFLYGELLRALGKDALGQEGR